MLAENKQGLKVLIAASILQLFFGMIYIWGIFVLPVSEVFLWDVEAVKLTASFNIGFFVLGTFSGGKLQVRLGATKVTLLGGFMVVVGMFLAAFTPTSAPWLLYITYGIVCGVGSGMGYIAGITAAQKWFPKRRGLATGLCVGAFGLSVSLFAPLIEALLSAFTLQTTFFLLSASFLVIVLLLGRLVRFPGETVTANAPSYTGIQYTSGQMVRTRAFYQLTLSLLLVTAAFFVVIPAVQTLSIYRGFGAGFATTLLVIAGFSNTLGRIVVPAFSDRVGNEMIVLMLMAVTMLASIVLTFASGALFVVMIALIPMCFGAALSIFPLLTADYFGIRNLGANYGALGIGFAFSALVLPGLVGMLGSYTTRFVAVAILSALGLFVMGPLALAARKQR